MRAKLSLGLFLFAVSVLQGCADTSGLPTVPPPPPAGSVPPAPATGSLPEGFKPNTRPAPTTPTAL